MSWKKIEKSIPFPRYPIDPTAKSFVDGLVAISYEVEGRQKALLDRRNPPKL